MSATAVTVIEREKVAAINREHQLAIESYGSALEHAIACGNMLSAVKADLPHGQWLPWLAEHTEIEERMAQRYMQLAATPEISDTTRVSGLSLRAALEQVKTPKRKQLSTNDVAGLLGSIGGAPRSTTERPSREPESEELWSSAQQRKRERVLDSLGVLSEKLDRATDPALSAFSISEILKAAALEARQAASRLDELAFSFER